MPATAAVVPTCKIKQSRLFVVDVTTITERLNRAQRAGHTAALANRLTPCIVLIFYNNAACAVKNGNNVALKVMHIGILGAIKLNDGRLVVGVVEEMKGVVALGHVHNVLTMRRVIGCTREKEKRPPFNTGWPVSRMRMLKP